MTIRLQSADLNYLLQQVNILNDYSQLTSPIDPNGVREVSGSNNNLVGGFEVDPVTGNLVWVGGNVNFDWGQSDTDFLRLFYTDHPTDGTSYGISYSTVVQTATVDANGVNPFDSLGAFSPPPAWIPTFTPNVMGSVVITGEGTPAGTSPRTITQLISNSDVDPTSPTFNQAAYDVMLKMGGAPVEASNTVVGTAQTAFIPNPGILGGVTYNEFFVAFGQFFDHGLDFISKGGGYVLIPLAPTDPLYDPTATGFMANKMMLNRASLSNPATDFVIDPLGNATLKTGVTPQFNNNTGLMIDQSQTYGSHESINALVRQYDANGIVTGRLIDGSEDGIGSPDSLASWADMKVNAERIGIMLIDTDVLDAPAIRVDAVGRLLFSPQHEHLYRSDETLDEMATRLGGGITAADLAATDPFFRDAAGHVLKSNQPILADMGNGASPMGHTGMLLPSASTLRETVGDLTELVAGVDYYDDALLAAHKVSGDGRVNENIGLTAVHHVFHEEHNIQVENIKTAVMEQATVIGGTAGDNYLHQWQVEASPGVWEWDGEKLYQAARIITESEYNHIAIDQYMGALYPALPEFVSYSADINLSVSLEFAQAVFRLGHSQLTEQLKIALPNATGSPGDPGYVPDASSFTNLDLFDAFLNPAAYDQYSPSGIISGLLTQQGNEMDEFVTSALQQSLVGVPLDLPALNIARGRDVGLPTLNELRQQAFDGLMQNGSNNSNGSGIAPYTSWADFAGSMRNPESLVNFIAAYGRDDASTGKDWGINEARDYYEKGLDAKGNDPAVSGKPPVTIQDIRAAAQAMLDAFNNLPGTSAADHASAVQFMMGGGAPVYDLTAPGNINGWVYSGGSGDLGFWDIDLWIGGLAEQPLFDGPLGTTFSLILLDFAQRLQDGDRFYYLYRMPVGHHLGDQIIGEQFSDLIMRTTGLEHIGDAFGFQSGYFYLDSGLQPVDLLNPTPEELAGKTDVDANNDINDYFNAIYETLADGSSANDGHIVVAGGDGNDFIKAALGDDYVYGDAGNDVIEGAQGNDHLYGGDGDDWITDYENDDFIHGGAGNDYISAGPGVLDTAHGGEGNDEVHGGDGIDEVFGDNGDDILFGEGDTDLMEGGDGNDFMDGGDSVDEMFAGNGNDWLRGGVGDDHMNGGSGNDLMEGGGGPVANDGDRYFGDQGVAALPLIEFNGDGTIGNMDIASYENLQTGVTASLQNTNATGTNSNLLDSYALVDGIVGSAKGDRLEGGDLDAVATNGWNNQLIGGGGSDFLTGLGDDRGVVTNAVVDTDPNHYVDWIFGDAVVVRNDLWVDLAATAYFKQNGESNNGAYTFLSNWGGKDIGIAASKTTTGETRVVFSDTGELGHILGEDGVGASDVDTAVYRGDFAEYTVSSVVIDGVSVVKVEHTNPAVDADGAALFNDGVDYLYGIEKVQFADQTVTLSPPVLDLHALNAMGNYRDDFNQAAFNGSDGSIAWSAIWVENADSGGVASGQIQIDGGGGGGTNQLRLDDDGDGASIQRGFDLTGADTAVLSFDYSENSFDSGDNVVASVSFDGGSTWHVLPGLNLDANTGGGGTYSIELSGLLSVGESFGANAVVKFEALTSSGHSGGPGTIRIDNLDVSLSAVINDMSNDWSASYTEGGAPAAIASGPLITDDGTTIASARIVLTNAMPGDVLAENGVGGDGISGSVDTSVPGQITLNLSGTASMAAYQAAIARVTFASTSNNPDTTPRVINVTVNDGLLDSNVAKTTVTVSAVDDPFAAGNDRIVTNIGNGAPGIVVPEWALLANDGDPDGPAAVADITGISGASGLSASLVTNPGFVTILDSGDTNNGTSGSFNYTVTYGSQSDVANVQVVRDTGNVAGGAGNDILVGDGNGHTFDAGVGDDIVFAGGGNDTIVWNVGDGRDFVDGGANTATGDRFIVNGNNQSETYDIYALTDPMNAGLAAMLSTTFRPETKIVITRTVGGATSVVSELTGIEELTIDTLGVTNGNSVNGGDGPGADVVAVHGNFAGTGLNQNTITINSLDGNIVVDISQMTSDEHVVLNTGGTYEIIGDRSVTVNGEAIVGAAPTADAAPTENPTPTIVHGDVETYVGSASGEVIIGTDATRVIYSDGGDDIIMTGDASTVVMAGAGADVITSGGGDDIILGGADDDVIESGGGNDKVWGDSGADVIYAGAGDDLVYGGDGADEIHGGTGDDRIEGGAGSDVLFGDAGNDRFVFRTAADADGDTIADFKAGDVIDMSFIDANGALNGDAGFTLLNATAFTTNGQLIVHFDASSNSTIIEGNTDGNNTTAEFKLSVQGDVDDLLLQNGSIIT